MTTSGIPKYKLASHAPMSPMSWYSGSQLTKTSAGPTPVTSPMARMLARRFAWDRTTPFGAAVLPDVYCTSAGSSSDTRTSASVCSGGTASSSGVTVARTSGTRSRSRRAAGRASGTVTNRRARALSRIPDDRRICSSIWDGRQGG
jgi:hypothetical protein